MGIRSRVRYLPGPAGNCTVTTGKEVVNAFRVGKLQEYKIKILEKIYYVNEWSRQHAESIIPTLPVYIRLDPIYIHPILSYTECPMTLRLYAPEGGTRSSLLV